MSRYITSLRFTGQSFAIRHMYYSYQYEYYWYKYWTHGGHLIVIHLGFPFRPVVPGTQWRLRRLCDARV